MYYWYTHVRVIYWKDIILPWSSFTPEKCRIIYRGSGEPFVVTAASYQQGQELLALLKEHVTAEENQRRNVVEEENR